MKNIIALSLAIGWACLLSAQTTGDALRYSVFDVEGTARTMGVGGGIGALGGDFSVLSTNPAGLAIYRTSELVFTPGLLFKSTESFLEGDESESLDISRTKFNVNNVGLIINIRPSSRKWKTVNIGIGMNRLADFKQSFYYSGKTTGSFTDHFLDRAYDENGEGVFPDDLDAFEAGPAYVTGAIYNPGASVYEYTNDFEEHFNQTGENPKVQKQQSVRRKGGINELLFSTGANYNNRLMIGATVGVPFVSFEETKSYEEEDPADEILNFVDMTFDEELKTKGVGINLKLGAIYRINQMFRIGAAIHTPTAYTLKDTFMTALEYSFDLGNGVQRYPEESPEGTFRYKLKTPWRYIGSLGMIIKKMGFITAEVELVNYSKPSFNLTTDSNSPADRAYEGVVNNEIKEDFNSVVNFKVGGEYAYKTFRIRAGYGITGSPYASKDYSSNAISVGLGYRLRHFYLDVAYKHSKDESIYNPYSVENTALEQTVNNSLKKNNFLVTAGLKF